MDFFAVVDTQRAIRRFRPDPVGLHDLRRVLEAATRAPSARGAEPWVFAVVRDPALRAEIGRRYRVAWDEGQRYTQATDADRDVRSGAHYDRMMRAAAYLAQSLHDAPVLVVCGLDHTRLGPLAAPDGSLRAPAAAYASIFPAVQNLLLAARALGLGTTLTTLHRAFEAELKALVRLPDHVEVAALVPLGWPRDRFGPTRRRPVGEVAALDRWGTPLPESD
ncbi:MAG TPA: nitroreductase family protein [Candidatus Binatia bacterium]|nr:nitroreductase family protein [Candidatus Binatia bacterium]